MLYFDQIKKKARLTHKHCPHCQKDCNVKTYKEHRRLFFNQAKKSWYVPLSTSEQTAAESDVDSSLASEEDSSSDGGSSMFEETEDLTSSAISHHAGHAGELYLNYQITCC